MPLGGKTEFLQHLDIDLEGVGLRRVIKAHLDGELLIGGVRRLEITGLGRNLGLPEGAIGDIGVKLLGIRLAAPLGAAIGTAKAGQRPDAGLALMIDDVIAIILIFRGAILIHHTGKAKPRAKIEKHRLEAADIAVRLDNRPTDGIGHSIGLADRAVEKRDRVMPF